MATLNMPPSQTTWQKITVPYSVIQTASLTNTVALLTLPALWIVHNVFMNVTTAFAGTTTLVLSVGKSSATTKWVSSLSVLSLGLLPGNAINAPIPESNSSSTVINLYATSTLSNLSNLTQGSVDIYLLVSQLS